MDRSAHLKEAVETRAEEMRTCSFLAPSGEEARLTPKRVAHTERVTSRKVAGKMDRGCIKRETECNKKRVGGERNVIKSFSYLGMIGHCRRSGSESYPTAETSKWHQVLVFLVSDGYLDTSHALKVFGIAISLNRDLRNGLFDFLKIVW